MRSERSRHFPCEQTKQEGHSRQRKEFHDNRHKSVTLGRLSGSSWEPGTMLRETQSADLSPSASPAPSQLHLH